MILGGGGVGGVGATQTTQTLGLVAPPICDARPAFQTPDLTFLLQKQIQISHDAICTNAPRPPLPDQIDNPSDEQFLKCGINFNPTSRGHFSL